MQNKNRKEENGSEFVIVASDLECFLKSRHEIESKSEDPLPRGPGSLPTTPLEGIEDLAIAML